MAEMCKNHLSLELEEIDDGDDSLLLHSEEGVSNHLDDNTNFQGRSQGGLEPSRKRTQKWLYCHHCNQEVSKSTYYRHKKSRVYEEDKGGLGLIMILTMVHSTRDITPTVLPIVVKRFR